MREQAHFHAMMHSNGMSLNKNAIKISFYMCL